MDSLTTAATWVGVGVGKTPIPLSQRLNIKLSWFPPRPHPVAFKSPFGHTSQSKREVLMA